MKSLKNLYYSFLIWWFYREADKYLEYDWIDESLEASQKALKYSKCRDALAK